MKYYHFIMAERSDKCYISEVVFLRRLFVEDFDTYAQLETSFFKAFQVLEGESLEVYFKECDDFFAMVEALQEQANEEGDFTVIRRSRKSVAFSIAHAMAKVVRKEGDDYRATFGQCLKLVRHYF